MLRAKIFLKTPKLITGIPGLQNTLENGLTQVSLSMMTNLLYIFMNRSLMQKEKKRYAVGL